MEVPRWGIQHSELGLVAQSVASHVNELLRQTPVLTSLHALLPNPNNPPVEVEHEKTGLSVLRQATIWLQCGHHG
jgi:hypothetical protein